MRVGFIFGEARVVFLIVKLCIGGSRKEQKVR